MHHPYEVRLSKPDGGLAVLLLASYASDQQAIFTARQWLKQDRPRAAILQDEREVADMAWQAPELTPQEARLLNWLFR
jgi:hypothetical protein